MKQGLRQGRYVEVDLTRQQLVLWEGGHEQARYPVSTASNGPGQAMGSGCTPLGWHRIRLKIGAGCPSGAVFVGRRPTGEIWSP
ncbi:MAG: murein L,D-transpeptidase, partial [Gammaproteobacteria bacterium]